MGGSRTWGGYTYFFRIRGKTLFVRYCLKPLPGGRQYRRSVLGDALIRVCPLRTVWRREVAGGKYYLCALSYDSETGKGSGGESGEWAECEQ